VAKARAAGKGRALRSTPIVVMAHPSFPAKSLTDVIALAKKEPSKLTVGTTPPPTINYFAAELFKAMAGAEITIVSYKGTGPLTNDLVGGHVAVGFNTIPPAISNIEAGRLRAMRRLPLARPLLLKFPQPPSPGCPASRRCNTTGCRRRPALRAPSSSGSIRSCAR